MTIRYHSKQGLAMDTIESLEGYRADSGTLIVPENRDSKTSRSIQLPVVRICSTSSKAAEPVFLFEGGPGLTNIKKQPLPDWLLENHDVVMVGYRGVDGSASLSCPEFNTLLKQLRDPLSAAGLKAIGRGLTTASQRLQGEGIDVAGYSLISVVDDMEEARKALGFTKINLLGGSYGGAVVYTYCVRYPESIHRSIMTEAAFPFSVGVAEPQDIDAKLLRLNELWKQSPRVSDTEDIVETIRNVIKTLPQQWNGIKVDEGRVKLMTFLGLYATETTAQAFDAFVAAKGGDYSGLAFMNLMWEQVVDWFNWGDMFSKIYSTKTGPERDYELEMDPPGSIIGSPLSKLGWAPLKYGDWPICPLPERYRNPQHTDVETLLIYGSKESAPKEYLSYFKNGHLVTLEDVGHMDVATAQQEASIQLQSRFLLDGIVDTSKYQSLALEPMAFTPDKSFQEQAKELLKRRP